MKKNYKFSLSGYCKLVASLILFSLVWHSVQAQTSILPSTTASSPSNTINVNGTLYFSATSTAHGIELWKSDGTAAGTVMVKDINPGTASSSLAYFTNVDNILYFRANDGTTGNELWRSDGTSAGTYMVKVFRRTLLMGQVFC
jgi:ELWxxDGT repeat protein